jgi:hypothetical protein
MATTRKKNLHSDEELLGALRVLESLGDRGSYGYDLIAAQLPSELRPPVSLDTTAQVTLIGVEDYYELADGATEKLCSALIDAWKPVTVKIGKKTITVELAGKLPLDV